MPRRASMDVDLGLGLQLPDRWCANYVQLRVVEAFAIERRLPIAHRRNAINTAWPKVNYEFADVVGWPDARERVLDNWSRTSGAVFAAELARMDQAHEWLRV